MKCTCPINRMTDTKKYSYYCEDEDHRRLASGRKDSFTSRRKQEKEDGVPHKVAYTWGTE